MNSDTRTVAQTVSAAPYATRGRAVNVVINTTVRETAGEAGRS